MKAVEIRALVKKYQDTMAVNNINLDIEEGEIYGILAPNGAGKSTTISLICSLLHPTSGTIKVLGEDIRKKCFKS